MAKGASAKTLARSGNDHAGEHPKKNSRPAAGDVDTKKNEGKDKPCREKRKEIRHFLNPLITSRMRLVNVSTKTPRAENRRLLTERGDIACDQLARCVLHRRQKTRSFSSPIAFML